MVKRIAAVSFSVLALSALLTGCSSKPSTSASASPLPVTTQSSTPTSTQPTFQPTTSLPGAPTSSTPVVTTSVPPTSTTTTPPVTTTSSPPVTPKPYTIGVLTNGVNDQYAGSAGQVPIKVGTTVRWTGGGESGPHTIVSETGLFGGPVPYEYTFTAPGVYYYTIAEIGGFASYRASITITA